MADPLALKYRPSKLSEVVGQREAVLAIRKLGTTRKDLRVILLAGQHGIGKTTLARIYAKLLNCQNPGTDKLKMDTCGECPSCIAMAKGAHPDYTEQDMGSQGGVDDVRRLSQQATMRANWNYRVFVLDEVHGASRQAFDALLKLLEEPPATAAFVLCTTALEQVPYTIISRSLSLKLTPLNPSDVVRRVEGICLGEGYQIERDAGEGLAKISNGSMRDALMNLERLVMLGDGKVTLDTLRGENWYVAIAAAPTLVKALLARDEIQFQKSQAELSSRMSYELLLKEALDIVCKLYIKRGKPSDHLVDALWKACIRISRALDPELVMSGLWLDSLQAKSDASL